MAGILPFLILLVLMYMLLIRPQQQRVRAQKALVESLAVGDEVITAGGVRARIVALDDNEAKLEVAPGVIMTFVRQAVTRKAPAPGDDLLDTSSTDGPGTEEDA